MPEEQGSRMIGLGMLEIARGELGGDHGGEYWGQQQYLQYLVLQPCE